MSEFSAAEPVPKPQLEAGSRTALLKETQEAFSLKTSSRRREERLPPDLNWLQSQCSEDGHYSLYTEDRSKLTILDRQSCSRWKSQMELEKVRHPLRQRRRVVLVQPLSYLHGNTASGDGEATYRHTYISESVLEMLRGFCAAFFSEMRVELAPPLDLSAIPKLTSRVHKRTNRRQYLVDDIIHFLSRRKLKKAYCILGVTVVDLYPGPEWNFVLGQANMEKGSGVFSFGRYFNSSGGVSSEQMELGEEGRGSREVKGGELSGCREEEPNGGRGSREVKGGEVSEELEGVEPIGGRGRTGEAEWEREQMSNLWVLMRVMSHELCHLFGLSHCYYFQCAMNESSTIQQAATQPLFLCPVCLRKLQHVCRFDISKRFTGLLEVLKHLRLAMEKAHDQESIRANRVSSSAEDRTTREVPPSPSHTVETSVRAETTLETACEQSRDAIDRPSAAEQGGREGLKEGGEESKGEGGRGGGLGASESLSLPLTAAGHVERMDSAIVWLENVVGNIELFKNVSTS